jgi:hypothetical protein
MIEKVNIYVSGMAAERNSNIDGMLKHLEL